jgi:hypothetical protein
MMAGGRPTIYTDELADLICSRVATHPIGLPKLCAMFDDMPSHETINVWRYERKQFSDKYAQAKVFQAELMAEELIELASSKAYYHDAQGNERVDAGHVASQALLVNTIKWHASKLAPKIYGDKLQTEHSVNESTKEVVKRVADINKASEKEY